MTRTLSIARGLTCPLPQDVADRVQLGHGSGGKMSAALMRDHFLPRFSNAVLDRLGDAAVVAVGSESLAISTDSFVVSPLEFPGGNIGSLAVNGTINDLAMMGARPLYLSAGFVLEEGLPFEVLDRVVETMAATAADAGVLVVTGDTKVVERGKADGLFINTTGLGLVDSGFRPDPERALPGDAILVSGPIARHGMAVMAVREGIAFDAPIVSDSAQLWPLVERLRDACGRNLHVLRDPTRGGVASALNEIAQAAGVGMVLEEGVLPVPDAVAGACEMLGLDPLYVANEGILLAVVAASHVRQALAALEDHPLGREAVQVGRVVADHPGLVVLETGIGGRRIVDMLPGDQLPRIC